MLEIVGTGLIATAFKSSLVNFKNSEWIIYASGVSNSQEDNVDSFLREKKLLRSLPNNKRIVYFSTCSVNISQEHRTQYIEHKIEIEKELDVNKDLIIRLPNVVGPNGNNNNVINFFINSIINKNKIIIQNDAKRNLIGISEVVRIVNKLIEGGCNGIYEVGDISSYGVIEIIKVIEGILHIEANIISNAGGYSIPVDLKRVIEFIPNYNNFFPKWYMKKILEEKIKGLI